MGREDDNQVAAPTGSKITALVLDWVVQDLVAGFDSPGFEVAGSSSKCAFASIVWWRRGLVLRNELPGAGLARSGDTVDGQWPRWLDYVPGA